MRFLVPWRPDGGQRDRLWGFTRAWWARECPEIEIRLGTSPEGAFNRSSAINAVAEGDWDVAVVLDADVVAAGDQVRDAIASAIRTQHVTLPYDLFVGLNRQMTERALAGAGGGIWARGARFRSRVHESSIVVVPRRVWDLVGGFDPRFVGWGQEDVSFVQAARVLTGEVERMAGTVWHLFHDRSPERDKTSPQYRANQALGQRYRETTTVEAMRELLDEREAVATSRARVFTEIYESNAWKGEGTRAGPGSSTEATAALAVALPQLLSDLGATSVLDAGCSEASWIPALSGYVGVDIVPSAVDAARELRSGLEFRVADICSDELPSTDAIICRDALQHLSLVEALSALNNFRRTGAKWLLANTHRGGRNVDISTGDWFEIDLEASPFWLGSPAHEIPDGSWTGQVRYPNKVFGAWEL